MKIEIGKTYLRGIGSHCTIVGLAKSPKINGQTIYWSRQGDWYGEDGRFLQGFSGDRPSELVDGLKAIKFRLQFTSDCFRLRHENPAGEEFWQYMMETKAQCSEEEFLEDCDPTDFLDTDETWEEWKESQESQADAIEYYEAENAFFIQFAGFEYIFKRSQK